MSSRWIETKTPEQLYAACLRERAQHWHWLAEMMHCPELAEATLAEVEKLVREAEEIESRSCLASDWEDQDAFNLKRA
jgi:hypothetical protein